MTYDLLMGEPNNLHFMIFWMFGRVHDPQNQVFSSLETAEQSKYSPNPKSIFESYDSYKSKTRELESFCFRKDVGANNLHDPINKFSGRWDQYVPENMRWAFGNVGTLNRNSETLNL